MNQLNEVHNTNTKTIVLSEANYESLKSYGKFGEDTFDSIVGRLLAKVKEIESK
jgi:hypothetical protein